MAEDAQSAFDNLRPTDANNPDCDLVMNRNDYISLSIELAALAEKEKPDA